MTTCSHRIPPPAPLESDRQSALLRTLRAGLLGDAALEVSALDSHPGGTIVAIVWVDGKPVSRVRASGKTLAAATREASAQLAALELETEAAHRSRISVDRIVGYAPLASGVPVLKLFALHPGVDGVRARVGDREALILPLDLLRHRLLTAAVPLDFIPDLKMGVDLAGIEAIAAARLGLTPTQWRAAGAELSRFRTESFVESPPRSPNTVGERTAIRLIRGVPERVEMSSASLREAALAGGRFLVDHLAPSGRYIYEVDVATGRGTNPKVLHPYSLPRHAGATYFLAELYRHTGEYFLREPIERAFAHLNELVIKGGCRGVTAEGKRFACVTDAGQTLTGLGSSALTVVALAEYKRATGGSEYDGLTIELLEWILSMQREDGSFAHIYDIAKGERNERAQKLYYSGEAALALARGFEIYGDPRYLEATRRALESLIGWYDFFAGGLFYGEEHWTCIAAEAIWPHVKDDRYRQFCDGYGAFLRLQQLSASDFPGSSDLRGTYGFTPFIVPANTPAGSRTEALISAYLLGVYHGKPSSALRRQILAGSHFSLSQQITDESAFWMPEAGSPIGGVLASPVEPSVRIDYVQHICSALLRTADLLERSQPTGL